MLLKIVYSVLVSLYSILLVVSAMKALQENRKKEDKKKIDTGNLLILTGGFLQFVSILPVLMTRFSEYLFILLVGLILILIGALVNGYRKFGKPHWQHHIVRLIISVIILFVFYISF